MDHLGNHGRYEPYQGDGSPDFEKLPETWKEVLADLAEVGYLGEAGRPGSIFSSYWDHLRNITETPEGDLVWNKTTALAFWTLKYNYPREKADRDGEVVD